MSVNEQRAAAEALLDAARQAQPGENFTAAGQTLTRSITPHGDPAAAKIWPTIPAPGSDATSASKKSRRSGLGESWKFCAAAA